MKSRKISRILSVMAVAFVIAMLLAISSFAYSVTESGTVAGLADGVTYTVAQYDFTTDTYGEFTALTNETVLTSGVWGISADGGNPEVLYVQGTQSGAFTVNVDNETEENFVVGKWTTNSSEGAYSITWYSQPAAGMVLNLEKNRIFNKVSDDWTGATPLEGEANKLQETTYTYGYTNEQVFPANAFAGYGSLAYFSNPFIMNEIYSSDYFKPEMILYTKKVGSSDINKYTIVGTFLPAPSYYLSFSAPDNLPADEYVVAVGFAPYANLPDDFYTGFSAGITEDVAYDYHFATSVALRAQKKAPAAPALISVDGGAKITVDNYNSAYSYQYSDDGGSTWIPLNANSFSATKASHTYMVKIAESAASAESEIAYVTSAPLVVVGKSLVLDGQIGTRVYIDVDESILNVGTLAMDVSLSIPAEGVWQSNWVTPSRSLSYATAITYDELTGFYYVTCFVSAKNYNKADFYTGLHCNGIDGMAHNYGDVGSLRIDDYINVAKAMAEAGDEVFIAAYDLVVATENYVKYADNYFNRGDSIAYFSDNSTDSIADSERSGEALEGIKFYGTSLLLEDTVTIRHYFEVTDMSEFLAAGYKSGVDYKEKDGFIYYDITDIPAQSIGDVQTLFICDSEFNVIYTVKYSVANYIKSMMNDDSVNMVSLVNAMYDYYIEANKFVN